MDSHPGVGVSTAQNFDEDGRLVPSFDHNKGLRRLLFGRSFLEMANPKRYPKRKKAYSEPISVDWVNGAFLFFRREAYEAIGGFDPNIFLYWEEMDLCDRLRKRNFASVLVPDARVLHYQGVSIGQSPDISKEAYRSYLYVIRKKNGYLKYLITKIYLWIVFLLKPKKRYLISVLKDRDPMAHSIAKRSE
jgi:GT2 family glycosyltransferase